MGVFRVPIEVSDKDCRRSELCDAVVGDGTFNTILPASMLKRLLIEPHKTRIFKLPDGSEREFELGIVHIRLDDKTTYADVIFADEGFTPTLGKLTLTGMLLDVDTVRECLVPIVPRLCNHPHPVGTAIRSLRTD